MKKRGRLVLGAAALALAGCNGAVTAPDASPSAPRRDGGAYLGAGFNVQPQTTTTDSTQRGGAYLGAGF